MSRQERTGHCAQLLPGQHMLLSTSCAPSWRACCLLLTALAVLAGHSAGVGTRDHARTGCSLCPKLDLSAADQPLHPRLVHLLPAAQSSGSPGSSLQTCAKMMPRQSAHRTVQWTCLRCAAGLASPRQPGLPGCRLGCQARGDHCSSSRTRSAAGQCLQDTTQSDAACCSVASTACAGQG